ncbi:hypothetical protein F5H01DRAFT_418002, partial [Linnemannia elongata]
LFLVPQIPNPSSSFSLLLFSSPFLLCRSTFFPPLTLPSLPPPPHQLSSHPSFLSSLFSTSLLFNTYSTTSRKKESNLAPSPFAYIVLLHLSTFKPSLLFWVYPPNTKSNSVFFRVSSSLPSLSPSLTYSRTHLLNSSSSPTPIHLLRHIPTNQADQEASTDSSLANIPFDLLLPKRHFDPPSSLPHSILSLDPSLKVRITNIL